VEYDRPARAAGSTKFNFPRLWNFALEGITSFSTLPLRVWTYIGMFGAAASMIYTLFVVARVWLFGSPVPGYPSLLVSILFLGSLQLFSIGVLGEYLGRTYLEAKRRPSYIVRRVYRQSTDDKK
jgi:polyisoprenyl-phosphate glycosyltransferase